MTNNELLINPNTGEEYINVPVDVAAKFLDFSRDALYEALKQGLLPFGQAVKPISGSRYSFLIPVERLKAYAEGKI